MKRFFRIVAIIAAFALSNAVSAADAERGTPEQAVALVKRVIADIKKYGKDKVVQDVQNQLPIYRERDLYVTIGTMEGFTLANGNTPKLAGKNVLDIKDVNGKFIMRERIEIAKTKNSGWQEYSWPDPVTKEVQKKSMYVERAGDLVVACGVYKL